MENKDFENKFKKEIDQLKDLYGNFELDNQPDLEQIRMFVRESKQDIEEVKAKKLNLFRAISLAGISVFLVGLKVFPLGALSLSALSILVMPIFLSVSKEYGK
jgi:hypothetical protein